MKKETIRKRDILFKVLFLLFLIYSFLVSIQLMGGAFKLFGKGFAEALIASTTNPFVGLFAGILATSILQSSSGTTCIVVGLVAGGSMTLTNAIPIILGANIGTTVTNTMVSLAHIHRPREFQRAFSGAVCHDLFNILSVIVLFPLQIKFHILEKIASPLTHGFLRIGGIHIMNPLKVAATPVVKFFTFISFYQPTVMLVLALIILFTSLIFITKLMRGLVATKAERYLNEFIFNRPFRAFLVGIILTAIVQSSSVTTSLMVPLIGAGIIIMDKIFPYFLGANIGTTMTAILASLATVNPIALTVAFCHLIFNCIGSCIFYPLRWIPIGLAKELGRRAAMSRKYVIIYIIIIFYLIPLALIFIWR
ncbi:Na/Pi symporter [candidate division WOR-3 bacterium]|nr:Na/Pi symporter [candidate division WOR-3 bacterium]